MIFGLILSLPIIVVSSILYWELLDPRLSGMATEKFWKDLEASLNKPAPMVGVYRKNYRGDVVQVLSEEADTEVLLPQLRFEDYNWEGRSIELQCNATFPVKWTYSGLGAPPIHMRTHRHAPDFFNRSTYIYQATVLLTHTTELQTGKYTCVSFDENVLIPQPFLYLYVRGNGVFVAEVEEVQTVVAQEGEPWLIIPCAVVDSSATVILFKQHPYSGIQVLRASKHLTFDPKMGFRQNWHAFTDPWGNYSCVGQTLENDEVLNVILTPPVDSQSKASTLLLPSDASSGPLHFVVDEDTNRILCYSGGDKPPSLKSTGCTSLEDCFLRQKYLDAKKCPPSCEPHVVDTGQGCVAYEMSDDHDESGMLQCSSEDLKKYFYFSKEQGFLITNFTELPPVYHILNIYVEPSRVSGKLYVSCHANLFFFSLGLKWAWMGPNGSINFIREGQSSTHIEIDKAEHLGNSIYCFAPTLTSATEWKSRSIVII